MTVTSPAFRIETATERDVPLILRADQGAVRSTSGSRTK